MEDPLHQCFNGQAIVDSATQVIVAADAFEMAADCPLLEPMLDQLDENLAATGAALQADAALIADTGYFSEDNGQTTADYGLDAHIATGRLKHGEPPEPAPDGPLPDDATVSRRWLTRPRPSPAVASTPGARRSSNRSSASSTRPSTCGEC
jgi:hypothetical protein